MILLSWACTLATWPPGFPCAKGAKGRAGRRGGEAPWLVDLALHFSWRSVRRPYLIRFDMHLWFALARTRTELQRLQEMVQLRTVPAALPLRVAPKSNLDQVCSSSRCIVNCWAGSCKRKKQRTHTHTNSWCSTIMIMQIANSCSIVWSTHVQFVVLRNHYYMPDMCVLSGDVMWCDTMLITIEKQCESNAANAIWRDAMLST